MHDIESNHAHPYLRVKTKNMNPLKKVYFFFEIDSRLPRNPYIW